MEYRRNTSAVWPQKTISEVMSEQANYINGKFEFKNLQQNILIRFEEVP